MFRYLFSIISLLFVTISPCIGDIVTKAYVDAVRGNVQTAIDNKADNDNYTQNMVLQTDGSGNVVATTVGTDLLADGAIETMHLADGAVTNADLAGMIDIKKLNLGTLPTSGKHMMIWNATTNEYVFEQFVTDDETPPEFIITTMNMSAGTTFSFNISAAGEFVVDWGDGNMQTITRTNTTNTTYSHTYTTAGTYTIGMSGQATAYSSDDTIAAISFSNNTYIAGISRSLGAIFSTLSSGENRQPRFYKTFDGCRNLSSSIPADLFSGITGAPVGHMFRNLFMKSGITGSIPENLFAGISGAPATGVFQNTFYNCTGLTGSIPENLFGGIAGAPAERMFGGTFYGCTKLTGNIPANLFAKISGAPKIEMFNSTFYGCSGLTGSIPGTLFSGITGKPASYMFQQTFYNCSNLTGYIPAELFAGVSGTRATGDFNKTFDNTGLSSSCPSGMASASVIFGSSLNGKAVCSKL